MEIKCQYRKMMPLGELKPHPRNPNKHSSNQIAALCKLIEYQGIRWPIIVSGLSGYIVAGHARLEAAKQLGLPDYPIDIQDFENEEQEYAFMVSDNAIQELSELDYGFINEVLPDLGPEFDIDMLGIPDFKIDPSELKEIKEKEFNENIETKKECPSCGYKW